MHKSWSVTIWISIRNIVKTLLDIETVLSPYVDEIIEIKEHYDEIFDNLPER